MITKTFLAKSTTIYKDSEENFGLNPICSLHYGNVLSRFLLYFDFSELKEEYKDKTYDISTTKHVLHMKNCGSVDNIKMNKKLPSNEEYMEKERATSFDIILFELPKAWDMGRGFDNGDDFWKVGKPAISENACNWYQCANGNDWETEGIYTTDYLDSEYKKFVTGETSIIIAKQHFDYGNENIDIDITDYVNNIIEGYLNETPCINEYGIGVAFKPALEELETKISQYVGFFNEKTNTVFKPYIETRSTVKIQDNRYSFYLGKTNKLYLYTYINGEPINLDSLPTCSINSTVYPVTQETKGVYSVSLKFTKSQFSEDTILNDLWTDIYYNGDRIDDIENEFVTLAQSSFFTFGNSPSEAKTLSVSISGLNDEESLVQGEKRLLTANFKVPYTNNDYEIANEAYYRIYVMDGKREVDIIDWDNIDIMGKNNTFVLNTTNFTPNEYHIDIKSVFGQNIKIFKNEKVFKIVNNVTEQTI